MKHRYTYSIIVYDTSPSLGDARNPDVKLLEMDVDCKDVETFYILCRKVRSMWASSHIELYAYENVHDFRRVGWED